MIKKSRGGVCKLFLGTEPVNQRKPGIGQCPPHWSTLGLAIPVPNEYPVFPGFGDEIPGKSRDPGIDFKIEKMHKFQITRVIRPCMRGHEPQKNNAK